MCSSRGIFYFESIFGEKRDKPLTNSIEKEVDRQNSLSPESQIPFAKGAGMNSSLIAVSFIGLMVIVFAIIGFVAMWRERH